MSAATAAPPARDGRAAAFVALCCLGTFAAKLVVSAPRTQVNHGDVAFYYVVAKNLALGRGFVIDYIWNFWSRPEGIPTFSNDWWMPLPSVLCALGMKLGGIGYASAQATMIVVSSVLPLAVYLLGRELWDDRRVALLGAALAATFHLFLDQPSAPLSHGPYVVLATLSLWLIVRSVRDPRCLKWAGAAIAATQLARSDGILLFAPLVVAHVFARRQPGAARPPLRAYASVLVAWAAVMSPWWITNLVERGSLGSGGSLRAVWMRGYEEWYSLPESVTRESWLADGWGAIWEQKKDVSLFNLRTVAQGLVIGAAVREKAWDNAALVTLFWLSWIGALTTLRRRFLPIWTQLLAEWTFYSLIFSGVGHESFRSGMYSLYPPLVLCGAAGLLLVLRPLLRLPARWRPRTVQITAAAAVAVFIVLGQLDFARGAMVGKAAGIDRLNDFYRGLKRDVIDGRLQLQDAIFMARDVHELNAITGQRCVMIPYESDPVIRQVARRFGVTHMLVLGDPVKEPIRPALRTIDTNPHYELVAGPSRNKGITWRIFRIVD